MKFENLQDIINYRNEYFTDAPAIDTIALAAREYENRRVRSHLIDLLAYGMTRVYVDDPNTATEYCTPDIQAAREVHQFLNALGLDNDYTGRDEYTFTLASD